MTKIDLGAVWQDAMALGQRNLAIILPVAGMFLLLPALVAIWFMDPLQIPKGSTIAGILNAANAWTAANWPLLLANLVVSGVGSIAILALLLRPERPTVAQALNLGALALPVYVLASLLQSVIVSLGILAFILPGLYLIGRTALLGPVIAAERTANPFTAIARSFAMTRGNGWIILLMTAIIWIVGLVVKNIVVALLAIGMAAVASGPLAMMVSGVVDALGSMIIGLVMLLVAAALYRRLNVLPLVPHTR